ncbi:MAG: HAD family hydrolase [Dongiaceae bacterium]
MSAALPRPSAILFDWDNTLVDNWAVIHEALNAALGHMGHPLWTLAETRARVRASARDSFPAMFGERWREAERVFYDAFMAQHLQRLQPMAGALPMLQRLAGDGIHLAVVSNKKGAVLRREAEHLGWTGHFGRLVGAGDAERDKPAREPVVLALAGAGLAPGPGIWFVGDTDIDIECGANSGCSTVLLRAEPPGAHEFVRHRPDRHVADCAGLVALIEELAIHRKSLM